MQEDFVSATARHLTDASFLAENNRIDNAGYLAGYAVECSLKAIIVHSGGQDPRVYGHDLATLGGAALDLSLLLSPAPCHYRSYTIDEIINVFKDWEPSLRYTATGTLSQSKTINLVAAARKAFEQLVIPIILDGFVEVPR